MATLGRMLCRIGLHRWITQFNQENGARYLECDRCGKQKDTVSLSDNLGG